MYYISLKACSVKGCSKQVVTNRYHATPNTVTIPSNQQWSVLALSLTIVGLFAAILVGFVVTVVAINRYRAKQKRKEQRYKYFTVNRIK
jgi:heme/copper-type cytochrome/quinol oxidase subunit 2